ncbi:hypothetical protein CR513_58756, partial [Mucuna pruriens]
MMIKLLIIKKRTNIKNGKDFNIRHSVLNFRVQHSTLRKHELRIVTIQYMHASELRISLSWRDKAGSHPSDNNSTSCLMKHGINFIPIFHFQLQQQKFHVKPRLFKIKREMRWIHTNLIWSLLSSEATPIKQKGDRVEIHRLPVTVSIHELFQLSASLNPEENLIPILQHPNP